MLIPFLIIDVKSHSPKNRNLPHKLHSTHLHSPQNKMVKDLILKNFHLEIASQFHKLQRNYMRRLKLYGVKKKIITVLSGCSGESNQVQDPSLVW